MGKSGIKVLTMVSLSGKINLESERDMKKDFRLMKINGYGFMSTEVSIDYDDTRSLESIKKDLEENTSNKYFIIDYNSLDEEEKNHYYFIEKR